MIGTRKMWLVVLLCLIETIWTREHESSSSASDDDDDKQSFHIFPFVLLKWFNSQLHPKDIRSDRIYGKAFSYFTSNSIPLTKELYLCPAETAPPKSAYFQMTHENDAEKEDIIEHCLYVKNFGPLETKKCDREAIPIIVPVPKQVENEDAELEHATCGHGNVGKLYSVQYELCIIKQNDWMDNLMDFINNYIYTFTDTSTMKEIGFDIYSFCYDHNKKETIYTVHSILSASLLNSPALRLERSKTFPMMTKAFVTFRSDFENLKNAYFEFENYSVEVEQYNSSDAREIPLFHDKNEFSFVAQKLVPDENMAFALWRKATFHYANVRPFFKTLVPLWNHIWRLIRSHAEIYNDYLYEIFTGAFRTSSDESSEEYLIDGIISLPDFWIIVVQETLALKKGVAIIVSDYFDHVLEGYCGPNVCSEFVIEDQNGHRVTHYNSNIRCCQITRKIEQLFGLEFQTKSMLVIDGINKRKWF